MVMWVIVEIMRVGLRYPLIEEGRWWSVTMAFLWKVGRMFMIPLNVWPVPMSHCWRRTQPGDLGVLKLPGNIDNVVRRRHGTGGNGSSQKND